MNRTRKLVALMLAVLLLLATLPAAGLADSYKVQPLKLNQWYSLRDYSSSMTIYKLKVTGDTIVNINWKNIKTNSNFAYLSINRDKSCDDTIASSGIYDTSSGTLGFVLYSGTYYIYMYDNKESGKVKFSTKKPRPSTSPTIAWARPSRSRPGRRWRLPKPSSIITIAGTGSSFQIPRPSPSAASGNTISLSTIVT